MSNGIFGISISAILANQYGMEITGQNLANVNSPGYKRQVPLFQSRDLNSAPGGVAIAGTKRITDPYLDYDLRQAISNHNELNTYFTNAEKMDSLFSNEVSDLSLQIQELFAGLQDLNNDPASFQSREVFLNQLKTLSNQFQGMSNSLDGVYFNFVENVDSVIGEVNTILGSIAETNSKLSHTNGTMSALLDQRDQLLEELAKYIAFTVNKRDDGQVDISMGKGNNFVLGAQAGSLAIDHGQGDFMQVGVKLINRTENIEISSVVSGGILGGLMTFRDEILSVAHAEIGRIAMAMADQLNQQNQLGMDINSELGVALFNDINDPTVMVERVIADVTNTGNGTLSVSIENMGNTTSSNYELRINAGNYDVLRKSDQTSVANGVMGAVPFTVQVDGIDINFTGGTFNDGDEFLLTPTRHGASQFGLLVNDVNKLALASPIRIMNNSGNIGNVSVIATKVTDTSNASFLTPKTLSPPIRIEFLSDTSYQIVNATTSGIIEGPITYDPSKENSVFPTPGSFDPGYEITLAGIANNGDQFDVVYNTDGTSDNRNGFAMSQLQTARVLNGNTTNVQQAYQQFANRIATRAHFADIGAQTNHIMLAQAQAKRDDLSSVNVDEEAANLMRYQQAYQAAAHLLSISSHSFDTLMNTIMR